jgi:Domain of unknown function (DUF4352)
MRPLTFAFSVAIIVALIVGTCGCTTQNSTPANPSTGPTLGNTGVNVTAKETAISQQIGPISPQTGYKFVAYNCTVKFINATGRLTGADYWLLRDAQDNVYSRNNATFSTDVKGYLSLHTEPNDTVSGTIVYEVPQNVTLKSLTYDDLVSNATVLF